MFNYIIFIFLKRSFSVQDSCWIRQNSVQYAFIQIRREKFRVQQAVHSGLQGTSIGCQGARVCSYALSQKYYEYPHKNRACRDCRRCNGMCTVFFVHAHIWPRNQILYIPCIRSKIQIVFGTVCMIDKRPSLRSVH